MKTDVTSSDLQEHGAIVVVTHRVREGQQTAYESWLEEIGPVCKASTGYLDLQIIRPVKGLTSTYSIVIRFDARKHLQEWLESPERKRLIEKAKPFLTTGDDFFIRSGLDFWFTREEAEAHVPPRWKQYLVAWSASYPMVVIVLMAVRSALQPFKGFYNYYLITFISTGIVSFLMTYVIMPRYTKLIKRWLFT